MKEGIAFSVEMLVERLKEANAPKIIKSEPRKYLIDFIEAYLKDNDAVLIANTAKGYKSLIAHLKEFEKNKGNKVIIKDVDYLFLQSFYNFLIGHKGHLNSTAAKQVVKVKGFMNKARKGGYEVNRTYQDFTIKKDELEVIALSSDEFKAMCNLDLTVEGFVQMPIKIGVVINTKSVSYKVLDKVKDLFLFGCYTGLRYSDLVSFERENVKDDFLSITVTKTKAPLMVPLLPQAKDLLQKYSSLDKPLPRMSNQKFNAYLKEVAKLANISDQIQIKRWSGKREVVNTYKKYEIISAHTARKTFVSVSLDNGMNVEYIMAITGHKSHSAFKRYVSLTQNQVQEALATAWA